MQLGISNSSRNSANRLRNLRLIGVLVGLSFALEGSVSAQGVPETYQTVIRRNPFRPPAAAMPAVIQQQSVNAINYRFSGYMSIGGTPWIGIENVPQQKSYLLIAGQELDGIVLKEVHVNTEKKSIVISISGETFPLDLNETAAPSIQALDIHGQPQVTPPESGVQMNPQMRRRTLVPPRK